MCWTDSAPKPSPCMPQRKIIEESKAEMVWLRSCGGAARAALSRPLGAAVREEGALALPGLRGCVAAVRTPGVSKVTLCASPESWHQRGLGHGQTRLAKFRMKRFLSAYIRLLLSLPACSLCFASFKRRGIYTHLYVYARICTDTYTHM